MKKQRISIVLLQAVCSIMALSANGLAVAASESKTPSAGPAYFIIPGTASARERVLLFPRDYSLGAIVVSTPLLEGKAGGCQAQGKIVVPVGKTATFIPSQNFYKNPSILNTIPADGLDSVHFGASSMDDAVESMCDKALSYVGHLKGLLELNLDRSDATDVGAAHASELPNLQKMTAFQSGIEGQCLKQFGRLKHLHYLRLSGNDLKGETLQYLASLPQLQYLSLVHCQVSDVGVKFLAGCRGLIALQLSDNPNITDKSIPDILALRKLRFLSLGGTAVTPKAILQLKTLPLAGIELPSRYISPLQKKEIARAFPGAILSIPANKRKPVDSDTRAIWGPLH